MIRPHNTFERSSQGLLIIRDILEVWRLNKGNTTEHPDNIARVEALQKEYSLNWDEFMYWCKQARA